MEKEKEISIFTIIALIIGLIISLPWIIYDFLFGHDIFISYARKDGGRFASSLADKLTNSKYSCFIDQWESNPSPTLTKRLKSRLKNSKLLVVLASKNALQSANIQSELEIFKDTGKQILVANFGDIEKAIWYPLIQGLPIIDLGNINSIDDSELEFLFEKVKSKFSYNRRLRLLNISYSTMLIILVAGLVYVYIMFQKVKENKEQSDQLRNQIQNTQDTIEKKKVELDTKIRNLDTTIEGIKRRRKELGTLEHMKYLVWSAQLKSQLSDAYLNLYKTSHKYCDCVTGNHFEKILPRQMDSATKKIENIFP